MSSFPDFLVWLDGGDGVDGDGGSGEGMMGWGSGWDGGEGRGLGEEDVGKVGEERWLTSTNRIQTWALEEARRRLEVEGILKEPESKS